MREIKFRGKRKRILLVEDGSVDTEKLERDGFYVIVYRAGSLPPEFLKKGKCKR